MKTITEEDIWKLPKGTILKTSKGEFHLAEVSRYCGGPNSGRMMIVVDEYVVSKKRSYLTLSDIESINFKIYNEEDYG